MPRQGTRKDLLTCARLLQLSPGAGQTSILMAGFEAAFKGRSLGNLPDELIDAMARHGGDSLVLNLRQGQAEAVEKALHVITDEKADVSKRRQYIQILGEVNNPPACRRCSALCASQLTAFAQSSVDGPSANGRSKDRHGDNRYYNSLTNDVRAAALALLASRPVVASIAPSG